MQQPPQFNPNAYASSGSLTQKVSSVMKLVYLKMTLGLIVTAVVAFLCASSQGYVSFMSTHSWLMWVYMIAWFIMGIAIPAGINKLSSATATVLFYVFSTITGLMFFTIFYAYSPGAITKTFFITAGTFGAMTVYGYMTNRDLSKMGAILTMALFGLIIAMLVNIFVHSSGLEWVISIVGVLIFVGLTAWDTQQVKQMAAVAPNEYVGRLATVGALNLYLDFINLFLFLLRIFGGGDRS